MEKQKLTQQKHAFTNQKECTTTQNKHRKTKARFSRLLRHLAWKQRGPILISVLHKFVTYLLTYLDTYHLLTAPDPHAASKMNITQTRGVHFPPMLQYVRALPYGIQHRICTFHLRAQAIPRLCMKTTKKMPFRFVHSHPT